VLVFRLSIVYVLLLDAKRIKKNLFRPYKQSIDKIDLALWLAPTYFAAQSALVLVNSQ
jgi:hypothetical protein